LVVSTGTVEANQEMGLHAPVVLDPAFRVGKTFGATGTPMAVLVDGQGKMASAVAAGAPAVLALAGQGQDTTILGCHPELCVTVQSRNIWKPDQNRCYHTLTSRHYTQLGMASRKN